MDRFKQDRLWFFGSTRRQGTAQLFDMFYNKNEGNPNVWTYEPDLSHQAIIDRENHNFGLRLTGQVTPRNKVNFFWDEQFICKSCENGSQQALSSPESRAAGDQWPVQVGQLAWTSPINNQLLVDVAFGLYRADWGGRAKNDPYTGDLIRMQEQCTAGCPANGNIAGLIYRSQSVDLFISGRNKNRIYNWRANMARVTGALSFKAGYQGNLLGDIRSTNRAPNNLQYRVNNGVPNQLTMFINDYPNDLWMRTDSLYVQGQWTRNRLTVQGALRYDKAWSWSPVQQVGPAAFFPNPVTFPKTPLVDSFNDIGPRVSVVYDLFGNGKTAVKGTFGRYLEAAFTGRRYAFANPTSRIPSSVARAWTDVDRDFVADCDLLNPNAQDLRGVGRRRLRRVREPEFRQRERLQQHRRSGHPARMGRAAVGLELRHLRPARSDPARVHRCRLRAPGVQRVQRDGQPGDWTERRHGVLRHGAAGPAAARWWWIPGRGTLRRQPECLRPDQQLHHLVGQVRRSVRVLQRHRLQR